MHKYISEHAPAAGANTASIARMCRETSLTPESNTEMFTVSEIGEKLAPNRAPPRIAPISSPKLIPMFCPIENRINPIVPTQSQQLPIRDDCLLQKICHSIPPSSCFLLHCTTGLRNVHLTTACILMLRNFFIASLPPILIAVQFSKVKRFILHSFKLSFSSFSCQGQMFVLLLSIKSIQYLYK